MRFKLGETRRSELWQSFERARERGTELELGCIAFNWHLERPRHVYPLEHL